MTDNNEVSMSESGVPATEGDWASNVSSEDAALEAAQMEEDWFATMEDGFDTL